MAEHEYKAVVNPCKLCMPLGAVLALKGVEATVILLHGSQGCATYMRRFLGGHFNEPVDIASTALTEKDAIYGGGSNLERAFANILRQYQSVQMIGIPTTCLAETIGDDVELMVEKLKKEGKTASVEVVPVSTPSYAGTHLEGYYTAIYQIAKHLVQPPQQKNCYDLNLIPGIISPADIRYLKRLLATIEVEAVIFPDYSETLDGGATISYPLIPEGGTPLTQIRRLAQARYTMQMGLSSSKLETVGDYLLKEFAVPLERIPLPVGLKGTDRLVGQLLRLKGLQSLPAEIEKDRNRLLDAMVDAHKVLFGKRPAIYGDADLVEALTGFALELGMQPAVLSIGGDNPETVQRLEQLTRNLTRRPVILNRADFTEIRQAVRQSKADLLIGGSDGEYIERTEGIPLVRTGFPVDDRFGSQRQLIVGYEGAMRLLDLWANAYLELEQKKLRRETKC
ncbi:MAG: nitrogenase component 1 [Bacillota bacterium]